MGGLIVGVDLGEEYSQLCVWKQGEKDSESISLVPGVSKYKIPMEDIHIFLQKSMKLLKPYGKLQEVEAIVFSVELLTKERIQEIKTASMKIGIPEERIHVQSIQESFAAYVLSQPAQLFTHGVLMLQIKEDTLYSYVLSVSRKQPPYLVRMQEEKKDFLAFGTMSASEKDRMFYQLIQEHLSKHMISSVFLLGEEFEDKWYEESLKLLCRGRRVFAGNNLFAKGNCIKGKMQISENTGLNYIYLGSEQISCHIGIAAINTSKEGIHPLLLAGENWYEAKTECEVLLYEDSRLEFVICLMESKEIRKEEIEILGLPVRPPRTTRLWLELSFLNVHTLQIRVRDLGFGELYPATDLEWIKEIEC